MSMPLAGQVSVSGTAAQVSSLAQVAMFTIKAPLSNANPVFLGPAGVTTTTGYQLDPGDIFEYVRNIQATQPAFEVNLRDLYVAGTAPDRVTWFASP